MENIINENIKQSSDLRSKIFNGEYTSFGAYCSCHKSAQLFCVVFFSSGQEVWTNENGEKVLPVYSKGQGAPALNCQAVKQTVPSKNASPSNDLEFVPHEAETFNVLVDEIQLNLSHLRMKPKVWRGYLASYYLPFITGNLGFFPRPDGTVLKADLTAGNTDSVDKIIEGLHKMRAVKKMGFSPGLSHYAK